MRIQLSLLASRRQGCLAGERQLYSQAKKGSAREKGGKVLNLHSATVTLGSLTNVRFAASKVFNDLKLCANTL